MLEAGGGERGCTAAPVPFKLAPPGQCTAWTGRRSLSRRLRAAPGGSVRKMAPVMPSLPISRGEAYRPSPATMHHARCWPRTRSDLDHQANRIALCAPTLNRCQALTLGSDAISLRLVQRAHLLGTLLSALTKRVLEDWERARRLC